VTSITDALALLDELTWIDIQDDYMSVTKCVSCGELRLAGDAGEHREDCRLVAIRERLSHAVLDELTAEGQAMGDYDARQGLARRIASGAPVTVDGEAQRWRVGSKVGRTIYIGDDLIGVMDTRELAAQVVAAVNGAGGLE
jgi:hypothetical protein